MKSEWRDISTAPKDGTHVLLVNDRGSMWIGWWNSVFFREGPKRGAWTDGVWGLMDVTHWQPLPEPPHA